MRNKSQTNETNSSFLLLRLFNKSVRARALFEGDVSCQSLK